MVLEAEHMTYQVLNIKFPHYVNFIASLRIGDPCVPVAWRSSAGPCLLRKAQRLDCSKKTASSFTILLHALILELLRVDHIPDEVTQFPACFQCYIRIPHR